MKWQDKLTAKERKHLSSAASIRTKGQLVVQARFMEQEGVMCWECVTICRKLEIPVDVPTIRAAEKMRRDHFTQKNYKGETI